MGDEFKGAMSPQTEKLLGQKLKFSNKILEIVDDPLVSIIDNKIFDPLIRKLPEDIREAVIKALAEIVEEMPEIEI